MSKARLVITAVVVEGRSATQVAADYGISRSWVYELLARYQAEGDKAFEPRSRRPKQSPNVTSHDTIALIVEIREELLAQGLDAGPETIRWHLKNKYQIILSAATITRHGNQISRTMH